jgi:hypothetical protein
MKPAHVLLILTLVLSSCAVTMPQPGPVLWEEGLDQVRLDLDPTTNRNTHPITLSPGQIANLLRGERAGERRNVIHRLISGEAKHTRAFRDDEILILAKPVADALAQARPDQRVYFHLSQPGAGGGEVTTTGWIFARDPLLLLQLSEVHDLHAPGPDISKYIRYMPDVPEAPTPFDVTFEPEMYLNKEVSKGSWLAPDQLEELQIRYREALSELPSYVIEEPKGQAPSEKRIP